MKNRSILNYYIPFQGCRNDGRHSGPKLLSKNAFIAARYETKQAAWFRYLVMAALLLGQIESGHVGGPFFAFEHEVVERAYSGFHPDCPEKHLQKRTGA